MQSAIFYIFILVHSSIAATMYYKLEVKSSFDELNQIFVRNKSNEYKKLNYLLQNLSKKTNVEFAIYNSNFGRKLSFISFMLASTFLFALTEYGNIILLLIEFILFLPEIYIYSKKATTFLKQSPIHNSVVKKWINLTTSFMSDFLFNLASKYLKFLFYNFVILILIFLFWFFLQKIFLSENGLNFDSFLSGSAKNMINTTINTTVLYDDKPLDVISGNKLSFSGILFTLSIGGAIIFLLVDNYNEQKETINRNIFEIKKYYQKWFQSKKNNLNFDPSKYDEFNSAVSYLRDEFNTYVQLNNNVLIYRLTKGLMIIIYSMGIFVIIGSDWIIGLIFKLFPIVSTIFIFLIFYLFYCFKNSTFYSIGKTNISSERNHTIYEFTDTSQGNYGETIIDKKNYMVEPIHK